MFVTDDPLKIRKEIGRLTREMGRSLTAKRWATVVNRITELRCALRLVRAGIHHFEVCNTELGMESDYVAYGSFGDDGGCGTHYRGRGCIDEIKAVGRGQVYARMPPVAALPPVGCRRHAAVTPLLSTKRREGSFRDGRVIS